MRAEAIAAATSRHDRKGKAGPGYRHYGTPEPVVTLLHRFGVVELDPCSNNHSIVRAAVECRYHGGLSRPWLELAPNLSRRRHFAYVNSEYGDELSKRWGPRCVAEHLTGVEIVQLVPARPDTEWWRQLRTAAALVAVVRGRLQFIRPRRKRTPSLFPSALFYYGQRADEFEELFSELADVYRWRRARAARAQRKGPP